MQKGGTATVVFAFIPIEHRYMQELSTLLGNFYLRIFT